MTGAKRADRRELDFYPTPAWMVDHLLDRLRLNPCTCGLGYDMAKETLIGHARHCKGGGAPRIFEPCVGEAHIVNTIRRRYPEATFLTNDLDERHEATTHADATVNTDGLWDWHPDWVITNPPFSAAFDIVRQAVEVAQIGVAMLLRVTWLEPTKTGARAAWLAEHPPTWELIMERFSFDHSGKGDSATTAWFVWIKGDTPQRIEIIPGRARKEALL